MRLQMRGWGGLTAVYDKNQQRRWLETVAQRAQMVFVRGARGPHSGIWHPGNPNRSSAPGEYPAEQSGDLVASMRRHVTPTEATVGTNMGYSLDLLGYGGIIKPRKMSADALSEARASTPARGIIKWSKRA